MAILKCSASALGKIASGGCYGLESTLYFYYTTDTLASILCNYGTNGSTYFNKTDIPYLRLGDLFIVASSSGTVLDLLTYSAIDTVGCSIVNLT